METEEEEQETAPPFELDEQPSNTLPETETDPSVYTNRVQSEMEKPASSEKRCMERGNEIEEIPIAIEGSKISR
jgi:hypothetical protein